MKHAQHMVLESLLARIKDQIDKDLLDCHESEDTASVLCNINTLLQCHEKLNGISVSDDKKDK